MNNLFSKMTLITLGII